MPSRSWARTSSYGPTGYSRTKPLYIEEILQRSLSAPTSSSSGDTKPVMVAAGKKAAIPRRVQHTHSISTLRASRRPSESLPGSRGIRSCSRPSDEEAPKKFYVAYRISKNHRMHGGPAPEGTLFLKLDPKKVLGPTGLSRDVPRLGHFGTGDLEITTEIA